MFKQDEVCSLTGVKPYVLRFWESEFDEIKPVVSSTGGKLYERDHIEFILKVKTLLFDEKLTIERVKSKINSGTDQTEEATKSSKASKVKKSLVRDEVVKGHRDINFEAIDQAKKLLLDIIQRTNSIQQTYGWI